MTVDDRKNAEIGDSPRQLQSEQAVIPQTGDAGVVETHGGATSLGTTPIGLGSVGPVQQHQRAAAMIMGETDTAEGAAPAASTDDQGMQARAAARPVGRETRGKLSGIREKITKLPVAAIALGLVIAAVAVAAVVIRRRQ